MERSERRSITDKISRYCFHHDDKDFIEITEWTNGEGWDIVIDNKYIHLTRGELDAILLLTKLLDYEYLEEVKISMVHKMGNNS
jgi:hypothetical protein